MDTVSTRMFSRREEEGPLQEGQASVPVIRKMLSTEGSVTQEVPQKKATI